MAKLFVGGRLARKADRETGDHTRLINSRTHRALKSPVRERARREGIYSKSRLLANAKCPSSVGDAGITRGCRQKGKEREEGSPHAVRDFRERLSGVPLSLGGCGRPSARRLRFGASEKRHLRTSCRTYLFGATESSIYRASN